MITQGLLPAITKLFPCAEHRYCIRHVLENMKGQFKGKLYKDLLYKCASSTTVPAYLSGMEELKQFNKDAYTWLSNIPPKHWSRSHFSGKCMTLTMFRSVYVYMNNMCEFSIVNNR